MKFTNNELSHNGSKKRLNTSTNIDDNNNLVKDRFSKKFSLSSKTQASQLVSLNSPTATATLSNAHQEIDNLKKDI